MRIVVDKEAQPVLQELIDVTLRASGIEGLKAVNTLLNCLVVSDKIDITKEDGKKQKEEEKKA